jgi:thiamine transporter ThiT
MPSMAVSIPTSEVIPIEIMAAVRMVLSLLAWMDFIPSLTFSVRFMAYL